MTNTLLWLPLYLALFQNSNSASNPSIHWDFGKRLPDTSYDKSYFKNSYLLNDPPKRSDGTTKSRIPDDTMMGEGLKDFTSLDDHLKEMSLGHPTKGEGYRDTVEDLDPKEVYYADDDLLIIKGGGFPVNPPVHKEPPQDIELNETPEDGPYYNPEPPSIHNEYNGNIPTIVKPPRRQRQHYWPKTRPSASQYSPYALFVPARLLASETGSYYIYAPQYPMNYIPISRPYFYNRPSWYPAAPVRPYRRPLKTSKIVSKPHYVSLAGDTAVNYLNPRPEMESDAEFLPKSYQPTHQKSFYSSNRYKSQSRRPPK